MSRPASIRVPADHDGSLLTLLDRSRLFFADLPDIASSAASATRTHEVLNETPAAAGRTIICRISISSRAAG